MKWVIPLFFLLIVATKSNDYQGLCVRVFSSEIYATPPKNQGKDGQDLDVPNLGYILKGVYMKTVIFEAIFGVILFCAALCLMLAYFDVLLP